MACRKNQRSWYDNSNAYRSGQKAAGRFLEPYAAEVLASEAGRQKDPVAEFYQGGTFPRRGIRPPDKP